VKSIIDHVLRNPQPGEIWHVNDSGYNLWVVGGAEEKYIWARVINGGYVRIGRDKFTKYIRYIHPEEYSDRNDSQFFECPE
jgi:hypothetical protein